MHQSVLGKLAVLFISFLFLFTASAQNNSLQLDGTDDYIQANQSFGSAYTIELWVKPADVASNSTIFRYTSTGDPTNVFSHRLDINAGIFKHYTNDGGLVQVNSTTAPVNDTWYHVAITAEDNGLARIYVNGVEEATASTGTLYKGGDIIRIGQSTSGTPSYFNGQVDEVRIWNTTRSNTEILNNAYNELAGGESGLVAYYDFNQGTAGADNTGVTNLPDLAGTNDGTLNGPFALSGTTSNWVTSTAFDADVFPPTMLSATTFDTDLNGQIDLITVQFSEDLDGASVTDVPAEFTLGGGYVISGTAMNGTSAVDLTLTESGTPDTDQTPFITLLDATLSDVNAVSNVSETLTPLDGAGPVMIAASTFDNNLNGFIDGVSIVLSENSDLDDEGFGGTLNTSGSDVTVSGYTTNFAFAPMPAGNAFSVTFNESGLSDTDLTPIITLLAGAIVDLNGVSIASNQIFTPSDEAAPGFLSATPTATAISTDGFTLDVEISEDGSQVAYSILANPSSAPVLDDVGTVGDVSGIISTPLAETVYQEVITGLSQGTSYDIYFLPYDGIGNRQVVTTDLLNITTAVPFSVTSTTPISHANNITASSNITINFDASLDGTSLTDTNIKVRGSQSGVISATYLGGGSTTLTIDPVDNFFPGERVTVTITNGVLGLGGEVANTYSLGYTVATAPFEGAFIQDNNVLEGQSFGRINELGDYNGDGELDIMIGGFNSDFSATVTSIYQNTGGTFTDIAAGVMGTTNGRAKWGDYDGDGDLDIAVIGDDLTNTENAKIYRNDAGTYVDIEVESPGAAALQSVRYGSIAWGDYDNDGDLDLFLSGNSGQGDDVPFTDIYENNGGVFTAINSGIIGLRRSEVDWGDYDGDGDLDIVVIGLSNPASGSFTQDARIYNNNNGSFTDIGASIPVGSDGMVKWGNYDNDNDLDLLISADAGMSILRNDGGGVFTDINAGLVQILEGTADWGDYDGDGDLDILLMGWANGIYETFIYRNDGSNTFTEVNEWIIDVAYGGASWGDFDGDGDLDIVVNGETNESEYVTFIYENTLSPPKPLNPTQVTTTGFTPNFEIPAGATDLIVDVSTDPAFGSFVVQNVSVGISGDVDVTATLSIGTEYYYRAKADYGGIESTYYTSKAFMVQPGNALSFTGNKYVDIYDDEVSFNPTGDFTIEFWFQTSKTGNFIFFEKGNVNSQYSVQQFSGDVIGLNVNNGTMQTLGSYNDGLWHHVAIVYRGTNDGTIYVDGVDDTDSGSITLGVPSYSFGLLSIGDRRFGGSFNMEGSIDELRLWDDERTLPEITANQLTTLAGSEEGLMLYYSFDKTAGLLLPDLTGQAPFDGDLTNMDGSEWVASGRPVPPPTLTSVSIGMDPSGNPNYARLGDVIDIAITASEDITNVTAALFSGGNPVTNTGPGITGGPVNWNIRYAPTGTDTDGQFTFAIDFENLASGTPGAQVTSVTDGSFIILDQTEPVITGVSISPDNATLTVNFDEDIFSDQDGLTDVTLSNFIVSTVGGLASVSPTTLNVVSGNQVEIGLIITGDANGEEILTVNTDGNIYNAAGLNLVLESNNTVNLNDNTAPILSGISVISFSDIDANIDISIDEAGTLYYVLTQSASQPSPSQIILGEDENSTPAEGSNNYNIVSANPYNFSIPGLTASTTYHIYWVAEDGSGNQSNVLSTSFTTDAPPVDLTFSTNSVPNVPLAAGTTDNLIYQVQMDVSGGTATMIGMFFYPDTTQSYAESDFVQFNFYESRGVDDFASATLIGSNPFFNGDPQLPDSSVGIFFTNAYTDETVYWYVTADISAGATISNTFGLIAPSINENFGIDEDNSKTDAGLSASNVFTIASGDTTPPTPVISSSESIATNINPIPFDVDFGEVITGFDMTDIAVGNGTAQSFVDVDGQNFTFEIVPSADGLVTVDIAASSAQDLAANDNDVAVQFVIVFDGSGPAIMLAQDGLTVNDTNLSGTISDPSDVIQISVDGGTTLSTASNEGDGTWSYDLSSDPNFVGDGAYSIYLDAVDTLGNQTIVSTGTVTIDQTAPSITFDQDGTTTNDTNLSGTISDPSDVIQISVDGGTTLSTASNEGDGTWSYALSTDPNFIGDGIYSIYLDAVDTLGNQTIVSTGTVTIDQTAPSITFDQDGTTTNDTNLSGTISDPSDVIQISVDGGTTLTGATNNGDGTWSYDLSSDPNFIGSAVYSIYLDAQDTLGNQTILSTGTVTIDQAGPVITFDQDGQTVNDTNLSGTISGPSDILQVSVDGGTTLTGATNNGDGTWSYDLSGDPNFGGDGAYSIYLDAVDILVNQTLLTTGSVTIDQTAPVITVDETGTSIRNPQITGAIDDPAATIEIEIEGETVPATNVGDGTWILTAGSLSAGLADGTYGVTATATDAAGNIGTDNTSDELIITQSVFALSASEINSTGFTARWSTGLDVQTYQVDISTTNDFSTFVAGFENFETTATGVFVTNLDFSTNYYYRVRLVNTNDVVSANSNTRRVKTTVDLPTLADSLALVQIYEAITPQGLDWETERLRNWDGVTLDLNRTRVDIVNISNTQAAGNMPNPFTGDAFANGGLSNMTGMDVSDNEITGLMDYSSTSVSTLFVNSNSLDFGDLEPIASLGIGTLDYSDQASIQFNETTDGSPIEVRYSNDYSLSMTIGGSNNTFSWFRNDSQISTGTGFVIDGSEGVIVAINYDNMGEFRAEVTSSLVPGLTIAVDPQTIWAVADMQVSVTDADGNSLTAPLDASMMETTRTATGFRVLEKLEGVNSSTFTFPDVVLGNYIIFVESDIDKYIPTYYGDVFEWTKADTLFFRSDDVIEMSMVPVPGETTGPGTLDVLIEEDFGDDGGRIEARRRAAKRKCGLRRKTGGGRVDQDDDEFELIAYGETDDNGEFQFGFLPEGIYRFFVEYPGIPLDESSFVQFEVGEEGVSDTDFKLAAFATEDGIEVTIETVLGVILEYFKDLQIYPNPSSQYLNVKYRHLKSGDVTAQLVDLAGNTKWSQDLRNGFDGEIKIDVSDYEEGIYILRFYDRESRNENVVSFRVIVRD